MDRMAWITQTIASSSRPCQLSGLCFDHLSGHEFRVTATFEDLDGRTNVIFHQLFKITEEFEQAKAYCVEGNEQNFDRLGKLLAEMTSS
ncbi:hypothetical protein GCM10010911_57490 [Paenibacillus nasutitermitis]|uniref:Activator of Hsp90 ATPase homologue 1/2-like C-terminal domain-containing protein n=1 Tax=Paenibacillus nasutitermitis TaxID=1652958 RepID=A0A917E0I2_9BACL|nr:hypothetical protein GCM10010911_57490 [Paenibacillus nasutitermitis]